MYVTNTGMERKVPLTATYLPAERRQLCLFRGVWGGARAFRVLAWRVACAVLVTLILYKTCNKFTRCHMSPLLPVSC